MILVTGGTGFLGSHLICRLVRSGHFVRATRRENSNFAIFSRVLRFYKLDDNDLKNRVEWVVADVLDIFSLEKVLEGISEIYHCAGMVSFQPGDGKKLNHVNIDGTANLVNLALEKNIGKFCHVSSTAAIGRAEQEILIDEKVIWKTSGRNSRYAVSKYGSEREVWRGIAEGLNAVIVNPAIILGPGEIDSGSTRLIKVVDRGLLFYTPGSNGFVDVRDVVDIMIRLMNEETFGERFVVSAENVAYKTLFKYIAEALGKTPPRFQARGWISELAWRFEFIRHYLFNTKPLITKETARTAKVNYSYSNKKIKERLNYSFIPIEQCIRDSCGYYLKEEKTGNRNAMI